MCKVKQFLDTLFLLSLIHICLPDSFVLITESSISVTVDQQELDTNTVAKICDIVMRETGKSADKIVIQSKY